MTHSTQSVSVSSSPTKSSDNAVTQSTSVETSSRTRAQVFTFEDFTASPPTPPARHRTLGQFLAGWEEDETRREQLQQGRQWVAEAFYGDEEDTVRTLRLRRGWSQAHLAKLLNTSQPHVARIERGRDNLTIETCRKLSEALGLDMNALDAALRRQEAISRALPK